MTTTEKPQIIKAEISKNFFEIVDRLFDNSPRTVCAELIQNARRAGATKISFTTENAGPYAGLRVIVEDNGAGISDMADLLRIRGSGWDAETCRKEDPAGMGFFCLSRMNDLLVQSHDKQAYMGENCEALKGLREVPVETHYEVIKGTRLEFSWPRLFATQLHDALREVGRHAPIQVMFNDRLVTHEEFRPRYTLDEFETDDVRVYIVRRGYGERLIFNFHGLVVEDNFDKNIEEFAAYVDVKETSRLQMVLPARNAIVRNEYFRELTDEIKRRIYSFVKGEGQHRLPYACWMEANELGVTLPPATASLRTWSSVDYVPLDPDKTPWLMHRSNNRGKFESVAAALELDGSYCLYEADKRLEGYAWYDELQLVTNIDYEMNGEDVDVRGTKAASNLAVRLVIDWRSEEPIGFKTPILIGHAPYGEDRYSSMLHRAGGFMIDPSAGLDEETLCDLIDAAWKPCYIGDMQKAEWNRQRTLDVRKCISSPDDALAYALRAAVMDALEKTPDLINYAGTKLKLECVIDSAGEGTVTCIKPKSRRRKQG